MTFSLFYKMVHAQIYFCQHVRQLALYSFQFGDV